MTEDEMVGWHHLLNEYEFEKTLGDSKGQGRLTCCNPWGCKELDMTERLTHTLGELMLNLKIQYFDHLMRRADSL